MPDPQALRDKIAVLDGKPTAHILWKHVYPEFRRPAKVSDMIAG